MPDDDEAVGPAPTRPASLLSSTGAEEAATLDEPGAASRQGVFSGGLWSAASVTLPTAATLALSIAIGRRLGTDVLGEQSLVAYVSSSIMHVLVFSVTIASVQLLSAAVGAGDPTRASWLSRWSSQVHAATGLLSASAMVVIGLLRGEYTALWILSALTTMVDAVGWAHASRSIAQRGWAPTSRRRLVAQAAYPLVAVGAVYAGLGIDAVFAVQLVVSVVLTITLRVFDVRTNTLPPREDPSPPWRPVLRLWGMVVLSGVIVQVVERRLELVFLDRYSDATTVAMYSVAFSLVSIPATLLVALIGAAMPAIAARNERDPGGVVLVLSRAARVLVALELVVVAGTVTVGPQLVVLAYGSAFVRAADLVRWLGFVLLLAPLGQLYTTFWTGTGRLRPVLLAGGCAAVVDVALAWVLVPAFSVWGAVVATMTAQGVSAVVLIAYTARSGISLDLRPGRLVRAALVALAAGAAAAGVSTLLTGLVGVVAAVLGFGVVLGLGSRLLGLLDPVDVEWVAGTIPAPAARLFRALSPRR